MAEPVAAQPKIEDAAQVDEVTQVDGAATSSLADGPKSEPFVFNVSMSCGGCSGAINRVLGKLEGIEYNVSLEDQTAIVTPRPDSKITFKEVNEKIAKTGKTIKDRHIGPQRVDENGEPIDAEGNLLAA